MKKKNEEALTGALRKISAAITEIADALDSMSEISDEPVASAKETKVTEAPSEPEKPPKNKIVQTTEDIRYIDVRKALAGKAEKGYRNEVKELLRKHNLANLSEIEDCPGDFGDILREAQAIGNT